MPRPASRDEGTPASDLGPGTETAEGFGIEGEDPDVSEERTPQGDTYERVQEERDSGRSYGDTSR